MIKDLRLKNSTYKEERSSKEEHKGPTDIKIVRGHASKKDTCRICITEDDSYENPLFNPCNCTGSMKFVHYSCLKYWLSKKLNLKREEYILSYFWSTFECEICKTIYPCKY